MTERGFPMGEKMDLRDIRRIENLCCLSLLFAGGGIAGWIYEMLFYRINDGMFVTRGQGFGPWLPIYGFGSVFISLLGIRLKKSKPSVFLASALISGGLEYITGWFLYHFFGGLRLWDYNTEIWNWGNIDGFICLRSVLLFAFAGLFLIYAAIPLIRSLSDRLPRKAFYILSLVPGILFLIDCLGAYILRLW